MKDTANKWFETAISVLTYNRNQRVWSVIVTLFGDLAGTAGDRIAGTTLSSIIEPTGIKPEAQRVALFRLRNDGWLRSEKAGRSSLYSLTDHGLAETAAATPRIYARASAAPDQWRLLVQDTVKMAERQSVEKELTRSGHLVVAPGVFLAPSTAPLSDVDGLVMTGTVDTVPDWLRARTSPPELVQAYADLEQALDRFAGMLDAAPCLSPCEVASLRTVIVHNWRKALLSHPDLPDSFFSEHWRGTACRDKVMGILDRLGRPTLTELDAR
ncbi:PaaX family transcriptional regulator C-terminal domain-containing protein [Shimia sp. SDUM112013]|uniref:PaaX family transcriptional regulator C-terminal domain-containing protein n=1 Tax=Shimia sp. SDUM112013 TaxID=3136160 RepID=UPI0032EB33DB